MKPANPLDRLDLDAIVVCLDPGQGVLVALGNVLPEVAAHWLRYALDEVEATIDAIYCPLGDEED